MPTSVPYPKVSLELSRGSIARWLVAEGEAVRAGQVLFEVDNDKAAVEVESPADGVIRDLVAAGTEVAVGAGVASIYLPGEEGMAPPVPAPAPAPAPPVVRQAATAGHRAPNPTPLARSLAREGGLALEGLAGTGARGRVQGRDVRAALAARAGRPDAAAPEGALHGEWLRRGEGLPLVLLHGFAADLNNWRGMLAGAAVRRPVLALDLPAHGHSPRAVPATLDSMAAMAEAALAGQGIGPLLLAGHSFGAALAVRIAARGRADVRALCLFAPAGLGPEINARFTEGILRAARPESLRPWLELLVHDPRTISESFLRAVVAQRGDPGLTAAMAAFADRFLPDGTQSESVLADLARLTLPARVVFGRQDRILPFHGTRALPGNVALHAVDACGHMPHLEHAALAWRILDELGRCA